MAIKSTFLPMASKALAEQTVQPDSVQPIGEVQSPLSDARRKAVEASVQAYKEVEQEMENLRRALNDANVTIAGLKVEVVNLELIRDAANQHAAECQRDKEQALLERGQLENLLDHIRCVVERAALPMPAQLARRRLTVTIENVDEPRINDELDSEG